MKYTMTTSLGFTVIYLLGIFHIAVGFIIDVTGNGKIVKGATIQFKLEVFNDNGQKATGKFQYSWVDLKFPTNNETYEIESPVSYWNFTCDSKYTPGKYSVQVVVAKNYDILIFSRKSIVGNKTIEFEVTDTLNGELILTQGNYTRKQNVASYELLNQTVVIQPSDLEFIKSNKKTIATFWFIDCVFYGQKKGIDYYINFTKPETTHSVQVLLLATSTPINISYVKPAVSHELTNSSELKNISSEFMKINATDEHKLFKDWIIHFNETHVKGNTSTNSSGSGSGSCFNIKDLPLENYTYGLFSTKFIEKEPIKMSPINGTNWLQDGEILNITVSCTGSPPFKYCYLIYSGLYNVTGKEKCSQELLIKNCSFNIQHLFRESTEYTIVAFLSNSVSHVIKPIAVNIYKVTKHPQLSVIIVPVAFSIFAVILIIFGVACYVQSKRSYTVEVADFDFANQSSDLEYKSFRERLRESVSNLFLKSNDFNEEDEDDEQVWSPNRKYGSMQ